MRRTLSEYLRSFVILTTVVAAVSSPYAWDARAAAADESRPALSLLMIEEPGCSYCLKWSREVEPGYVRSDEGQLAPLVKVMRGDPAIADIQRIVFTPTFVLMRDGHEIGRIVGYAGADLFWWQLSELLRTVARDGLQVRAG